MGRLLLRCCCRGRSGGKAAVNVVVVVEEGVVGRLLFVPVSTSEISCSSNKDTKSKLVTLPNCQVIFIRNTKLIFLFKKGRDLNYFSTPPQSTPMTILDNMICIFDNQIKMV